MQPVGRAELQRCSAALERNPQHAVEGSEAKQIRTASMRLVRDLEMKGVLRTNVEACNLAVHDDENDVLSAEYMCTFPGVDFPASVLLRREEVESGKAATATVGAAVIAAGPPFCRRAYVQAPFDMQYGYGGQIPAGVPPQPL